MMISNDRHPESRCSAGSVPESLNGDGWYGGALLGVLAALWLLLAAGPRWTEALCYQRQAIAGGEYWRLLTAHWVHLGARHLLLDSAGLILLWALYARELKPLAWLLVWLGGSAVIDAGLWWGEPQVQWYVGISGLLHAAWAAGALAMVLRRRSRERGLGLVMLAALAVKLMLEGRSSTSVWVPGMPVVSAAHAYGALAGTLIAALVARALAADRESL